MPLDEVNIAGWDIGGANVKVAVANKGVINHVHQLDCPLWKGLNKLQECIDTLMQSLELQNARHAITMTGELVDLFDNRRQGVSAIIQEMSSKLSPENTKYFAGGTSFLDAEYACNDYEIVASANWMASAQYTSKKIKDALFIDIGTTTTDIVPIQNHKVINDGYSDEQRLIAKELIYCGVVRTPVFALCKQALVNGHQIPIVNEYFSDMADVYRMTGELAQHADVSETLDGRSKDRIASMKRLARMFANDAIESEFESWLTVAKQIRRIQIQHIKDACRHQLMKKTIQLDTPVIGAGVGRFLAKELAKELGREYIDIETIFSVNLQSSGFNVADCAPAAALACLYLPE